MTCCAPVILVLRYLENTRRGICLSNNTQKLLTNDAREWSSQEDQPCDAGVECERSHWCRYSLDARGYTRLDKDRRRVRRTLGRWLEYTHRTGRRKAIRHGDRDRSRAAGDDLFTLDLSPLGEPTEND